MLQQPVFLDLAPKHLYTAFEGISSSHVTYQAPPSLTRNVTCSICRAALPATSCNCYIRLHGHLPMDIHRIATRTISKQVFKPSCQHCLPLRPVYRVSSNPFIARTMASTTAAPKYEWLVILPDQKGALKKRMDVRPYVSRD